jgi:hypothetical protein
MNNKSEHLVSGLKKSTAMTKNHFLNVNIGTIGEFDLWEEW